MFFNRIFWSCVGTWGLAACTMGAVPSSGPQPVGPPTNPAIFEGTISCVGTATQPVILRVAPTRGTALRPNGFLAEGIIGQDTNLGALTQQGQSISFQLFDPSNTQLSGPGVFAGAMDTSGNMRLRIPGRSCNLSDLQPQPSPQMTRFLAEAFGGQAQTQSPTGASRFCLNLPLPPATVTQSDGYQRAQAKAGGLYLYHDSCAQPQMDRGRVAPALIFSTTPWHQASDKIESFRTGDLINTNELRPVAWAEECMFATQFNIAGQKPFCLPDGYRYRQSVMLCLQLPVDGSLTGRISAAALAACVARTTRLGTASPFVPE